MSGESVIARHQTQPFVRPQPEARTIREPGQGFGFTPKLGRLAVVESEVFRQEVFRLNARQAKQASDVKLGERALTVAFQRQTFQRGLGESPAYSSRKFPRCAPYPFDATHGSLDTAQLT